MGLTLSNRVCGVRNPFKAQSSRHICKRSKKRFACSSPLGSLFRFCFCFLCDCSAWKSPRNNAFLILRRLPDEILAPIKLIFHSLFCYYFYQFIRVVVLYFRILIMLLLLLLLLLLFCVFLLKPLPLHFIYFGELITTQEIMRVPHNGYPCTRPHFRPIVLKAFHCCYLGLIYCCNAICIILILLGKTYHKWELSGSVAKCLSYKILQDYMPNALGRICIRCQCRRNLQWCKLRLVR